jgi:tetratricopeptide (TPR) repeat protein
MTPLEKIMNIQARLVIAIVGASILNFTHPQFAQANPSKEVSNIAKSVTVLIEFSGIGSGVLLKQDGKVYTVLTAGHVFDSPGKHTIVAPDKKRYPIDEKTVKKIPGVDLALFQFTSDNTYSTVKIGDSTEAIEGTLCYVAGFPAKDFTGSESVYSLQEGEITAHANRPLKDGYALMYTNPTLPGMSGGPVLNDRGELIGIHGRGAESTAKQSEITSNQRTKTEFNLGIPISTFLSLVPKVDRTLSLKAPPSQSISTQPKADDHILQGSANSKRGDFRAEIAEYDKAIALNPKYAAAYNNRGNARSSMGDKQGAIKDYTQAINIDPKYVNGYYNRGVARGELGDKQGAIEDYSLAIAANPSYVNAYLNRGVARSELGDKQGAINDFNQIIALDPKDALAYKNRGTILTILGNKQGAINDFTQAIALDPKDVSLFFKRGLTLRDMGDRRGAIADYTQAITIDPTYALAYMGRAVERILLGNKQGAIADLRRGADLFQQQNNPVSRDGALELMRSIQKE